MPKIINPAGVHGLARVAQIAAALTAHFAAKPNDLLDFADVQALPAMPANVTDGDIDQARQDAGFDLGAD